MTKSNMLPKKRKFTQSEFENFNLASGEGQDEGQDEGRRPEVESEQYCIDLSYKPKVVPAGDRHDSLHDQRSQTTISRVPGKRIEYGICVSCKKSDLFHNSRFSEDCSAISQPFSVPSIRPS